MGMGVTEIPKQFRDPALPTPLNADTACLRISVSGSHVRRDRHDVFGHVAANCSQLCASRQPPSFGQTLLVQELEIGK